MKFEFDPRKSASNKEKHGMDFIEAQVLCERWTLEIPAKNVDGQFRYAVLGEIGTGFTLRSSPTEAEQSESSQSVGRVSRKSSLMSAKKPNAGKTVGKRKIVSGEGKPAGGDAKVRVPPHSAAGWIVKLEGVVVTRSKGEAVAIARQVKDGRLSVIVEEARVKRVTDEEFDRISDEDGDISSYLDLENARWVPPLKK